MCFSFVDEKHTSLALTLSITQFCQKKQEQRRYASHCSTTTVASSQSISLSKQDTTSHILHYNNTRFAVLILSIWLLDIPYTYCTPAIGRKDTSKRNNTNSTYTPKQRHTHIDTQIWLTIIIPIIRCRSDDNHHGHRHHRHYFLVIYWSTMSRIMIGSCHRPQQCSQTLLERQLPRRIHTSYVVHYNREDIHVVHRIMIVYDYHSLFHWYSWYCVL